MPQKCVAAGHASLQLKMAFECKELVKLIKRYKESKDISTEEEKNFSITCF